MIAHWILVIVVTWSSGTAVTTVPMVDEKTCLKQAGFTSTRQSWRDAYCLQTGY